MKTKSILSGAASLALPVFLTFAPTLQGQDKPKMSSSMSFSMTVDPSSPNFNPQNLEKQIRGMTSGMNLSEEQQKSLDKAIEDLKAKAKPGSEKFTWKWENSNGDSSPKLKLRTEANEDKAPAPKGMNMQNLLKDLLENGGNFHGGEEELGKGLEQMMRELMKGMGNGRLGEKNDNENSPQSPKTPKPGGEGQAFQDMMRKMMEDMMRGEGGGGGGQRRFEFEMGPDGKLKPRGGSGGQSEDEGSPGGAPFDLGKLFGMGGARGSEFDPDRVDRDSKYSRSTLAEYRSVVRDARKSTVNILREGRRVALGIVVSDQGHILTVASELKKGKLEIETMDGQIIPVEVLDRDSQSSKTYDIALLQSKEAKLSPIAMAEGELEVGTMLAAAGIDEDPISVGVLSVGSRNLDLSRKPMLGISMDRKAEGEGVPITLIVPGGPAEKAGLKVDDRILTLNGEAVKSPEDVISRVNSKRVGEEIALKIKRGDKEEAISLKLASKKEGGEFFAQGPDQTARMGTDLTKKVASFPNALTNDLGVNANQCGGPVLNIEGKMVGINLARSGRTSTFMINNKVIKDLLADMSTGKLGIVLDKETIEQDITAYEEELKKAQLATKELEEKLQKAKEAKEKIK